MRSLIMAIFSLVALSGQVSATTYNINLNEYTAAGYLPGPCYCGAGPRYAVTPLPPGAVAGDTLDFGYVKIFSVQDARSTPYTMGYPFFPYYYGSDDVLHLLDPEFQRYIIMQTVFQGAPTISFHLTPYDALDQGGSFFHPIDSFEIFSLRYVIPDGALNYEIGWTGYGIYTAAVPEPSTWAMLLIGFAGMGTFSYRRRQRSTGSGSPQEPAPRC
jgi:hypothetical protein